MGSRGAGGRGENPPCSSAPLLPCFFPLGVTNEPGGFGPGVAKLFDEGESGGGEVAGEGFWLPEGEVAAGGVAVGAGGPLAAFALFDGEVEDAAGLEDAGEFV